jgi:hypothetical protein
VRNNLKSNLSRIESPGKHLIDLLVNIEKKDKPNSPRYVKNQRRFIKCISAKDETTDSSSDSIISSDDEETVEEIEVLPICSYQKQNQNRTLTKVSNQNKNENINKLEKLPVNVSGDTVKNSVFRKKSIDSVAVVSTTMHPILKSHLVNTNTILLSNESNESVNREISSFTDHIPSWGGTFLFGRYRAKVVNTCTIDNYLFALWVISKIDIRLIEIFPVSEITFSFKKIINKIESNEWDSARLIWYTEVMKRKITNKEISFFGTVQDFFIKYLYQFQQYDLIQKCKVDCLKDKSVLESGSHIIILAKVKNTGIQIENGHKDKCEICKQIITHEIKFYKIPSILIKETESRLKLIDLADEMTISSLNFKLLCGILHVNSNHFVSIF